MKSILLKLPDGQEEKFAQKLAELMKECGASAQITTPEAEQYEPEEGDFVAFADDSCDEPYIGIFKGWYCDSRDKIVCYAHITDEGELLEEEEYWNADTILRPASDEEKERLVKALAKDKKRWNPETKGFDECESYEAIRTFEDACHDLNRRAEAGDEISALLLSDYESNADNIKMPETLAYMKLCIVARAINEGWEPKFTKDEYRYYPWFYLYTQEEIDAMSEENRANVLFVGGGANYGASCGVSSATSHAGFSYSTSYIGARLAFYDSRRAKYAGRQFIELYAALNFRAVETGNEKSE